LGRKLVHDTYFDTIQVLTEDRDAVMSKAAGHGHQPA
jgi:hypothetical protein